MSGIRRNARLRREFLYRKSLEGPEREQYERKERLKAALAAGAPIPSDLRGAGLPALREALAREDGATIAPRSSVDDEYGSRGAGAAPRVLLTTSRDPSARLRAFAAEVRLLFPGAARSNRGNTGVKEVVAAAREAGYSDVVMLQETRGEPDALIVSHLPFGPTAFFSLSGAVMRHDLAAATRGTVSEAHPHLIFHNFTTPLGARVRTILAALFPVPKADAHRVLTFSNESDFISFRHHTYEKAAGATPGAPLARKDVLLKEVGPRFELHPYLIRLGTLDQEEAETEWALRSFTNTARKVSRL